jgi:hypothetical protein
MWNKFRSFHIITTLFKYNNTGLKCLIRENWSGKFINADVIAFDIESHNCIIFKSETRMRMLYSDIGAIKK